MCRKKEIWFCCIDFNHSFLERNAKIVNNFSKPVADVTHNVVGRLHAVFLWSRKRL